MEQEGEWAASLREIRLRKIRRMFDPVLRDLDWEPGEERPLQLYRGRVRAVLARTQGTERSRRAYARTAHWSLPGSSGRGRPVGRDNQRIPHTRNRTGGHAAAEGPVPAVHAERYNRRQEEAALAAMAPLTAITDDRYLNRLEADAIGHGQPSALRTNMDPDAHARDREWTARTRHERKAGRPRINVNAERDPVLCQRIADDTRWPESLRIAISKDLDRMRCGRMRAKWKAAGEPWIDDEAEQVLRDIRALYGIDPAAEYPALAFGRPRSGRVFYAWDGELPRGLSEAERQSYLDEMAADLAATGIRFVLVMHRPDPTNHPDNHHVHLLYADRPVDQLVDGRFDIEQTFERDYGRGRRRTVHERQPKLRFVSERSWTRTLREAHVRHCNAALERSRLGWRYSPGGFADVGLDREKRQRKLGTAAARLEAAGVATDIGVTNALIDWERVDEARDRKHARRMARIALVAELLTERSGATSGEFADWRNAAERTECARVAAEEIADAMAMATSRPRSVIGKAGAIADTYDEGTYERHRWTVRRDKARDAEREIERALDLERGLLARARHEESVQRHRRDELRAIARAACERRWIEVPVIEPRTVFLSTDNRLAHRFINLHQAQGIEVDISTGALPYPQDLLDRAGLAASAFDHPHVRKHLEALHARQRTEIAAVVKLAARGFKLDARSDTPHVRELIARWRGHVLVEGERGPFENSGQTADPRPLWHRAAEIGNAMMANSDALERCARAPSGRIVPRPHVALEGERSPDTGVRGERILPAPSARPLPVRFMHRGDIGR